MEVEQIPKSESAQKVDPGDEHSPATPAGTQNGNISITSQHSNHWAIPAPKSYLPKTQKDRKEHR